MILKKYFSERIDEDAEELIPEDLDDINFHEHAERVSPNNNRVVVTATIGPELEDLINLNEFEESINQNEFEEYFDGEEGLRVVECKLIQAGGRRTTSKRRSSKRRTTGGKRVSSKKRTTSKRRRSFHRRRF
jgi:hypothetical protein